MLLSEDNKLYEEIFVFCFGVWLRLKRKG